MLVKDRSATKRRDRRKIVCAVSSAVYGNCHQKCVYCAYLQIRHSRIENATNDIIGNFRKLADVGYMIVYLIRHTLKNKTTTHVAVFSSTQIFVC